MPNPSFHLLKNILLEKKNLSDLSTDELLELYSSNVTAGVFREVEAEIIKRLTTRKEDN